MDLLLKILKVSALLLIIFVLAVLCAPTLKGPFVIIHFATTLKAWLLAQIVFLGFVLASHLLIARILVPLRAETWNCLPQILGFTPAVEPLRC